MAEAKRTITIPAENRFVVISRKEPQPERNAYAEEV